MSENRVTRSSCDTASCSCCSGVQQQDALPCSGETSPNLIPAIMTTTSTLTFAADAFGPQNGNFLFLNVEYNGTNASDSTEWSAGPTSATGRG